MSQQLWGPALEAEVAYRQERARQAYQAGPLPGPRTLGRRLARDLTRVLDHRGTRRRAARPWDVRRRGPSTTAVVGRARPGARPVSDALGVAARQDVVREERGARRAAEIERGVAAMRPRPLAGRRP